MPPHSVLGFDVGSRRIGLAIGDSLTGTARPLATVACREGIPDWPAIDRHLADWRPRLLVVGVPHHADGSANVVTEACLAFAAAVAGRSGLPVATIDERLSSREADARLAERNRRPGPGERDAVAAAVIVETWLATCPDSAPDETCR